MKLEEVYVEPDVECPHCGAALDVMQTFEVRDEECCGDAKCPICFKTMEIDTRVVFTASKIGKRRI